MCPPPPGELSLTENTIEPLPLMGNVPVPLVETEATTMTLDFSVTFVIGEAIGPMTVPGFPETGRGPTVAYVAEGATASGTALRGPRLGPAPSAPSLDISRKTVLMLS